jgi:hypothetical protein
VIVHIDTYNMSKNKQSISHRPFHIHLKIGFILLVIISGSFTVSALTLYHTAVENASSTHSTTSQPTKVISDPVPTTVVAIKPATTIAKNTSTNTVTVPAPLQAVVPSPHSAVTSLAPTSTTTPASTSPASGSSSGSSGVASTSTITYHSTNWSGYMTTGSKSTAVSGSWIATNPTATSTTAASFDATWIGIGGVTSADLIQVGTSNTISASGVVSSSAFYELLPAPATTISSLVVNPGDHMSASITETSTSIWTVTITNLTRHQTSSISLTYTSAYSSAEWIEEDPSYINGNQTLLDNFGTASFADGLTTIGGVSVSIAAANASSITMVNSQGKTVAVPNSVVNGSFNVTYQP